MRIWDPANTRLNEPARESSQTYTVLGCVQMHWICPLYKLSSCWAQQVERIWTPCWEVLSGVESLWFNKTQHRSTPLNISQQGVQMCSICWAQHVESLYSGQLQCIFHKITRLSSKQNTKHAWWVKSNSLAITWPYIFSCPGNSQCERISIPTSLRARAILLVFEKFTRAYLFQIAQEKSCDYLYK